MTVLLVSHGFEASYERGLCNGLAQAGVSLLLISSDTTDYAGLDSRVPTLNLRGSQDPKRPKWAKLLNLVSYHGRLAITVVRRRPKVVHVIGLIEPYLLRGVLEALWFRLWCRRYVLTVHDLLPHGRHTRAFKLLGRVAFRIPQLLVVHTAQMRESLATEFGVPREKVVVMEHGIEPMDVVMPVPTPMSATEQRPLKLLFFGVVAPYKGVDILLEALDGIGIRCELRVAGVCLQPEYTQRLRQRMARLGRSATVTWDNAFVDEADIPSLFLEADALVLPYRHIYQSGVLFKALRFGLPVVATRVGSFAHYVNAEIGEIGEPTPAGVRVALERFAARRASFDRNHIAAVGRQYEWPITVRPLAAAYQAL